ncbi:MAG: hypothetical protein A2Z21_05645 [Candidatus Fraserbacteria bacterium RBG_16_55_9]|uniref:Tryptophan synthase beta chain-like PALP domain-containing protein n=1 Tax=Fraserbacteria sp. (strain RBG_16_55_9) TaxID=1817864 RepID=A0A1F5UPL8_FRAXR|nr:MAG: hypothetical protein A2Z21_05645 [Candidatus Fraserbacteria bacterium RBG_16_55_9]
MGAYRCTRCGERYPADTHLWSCRCGGLFELHERLPFRSEAIEHDIKNLWRYRAMIPLEANAIPISLGEGFTPLIPLAWDEFEILCKLEFLAPTGSFKDRGTTVLVSALQNWGIREVVEDSSGNAGASLAAYSAYAGIHCRIYVPAHASGPKLTQIRAYGAELVPIEGPREKAAHVAQEAAKKSYYASHAYHPLVLEGLKTFAYEVWEQLDRRSPDAVVFPTGHGTFLLGAHRGFQELQVAGLIEALPRLVAVQSENCAPLYDALQRGSDELLSYFESGNTIAEGIRITQPARAQALLHAIRETGGEVLTVSDAQIDAAQQVLARRGLFVEPTSAVAVAGLLHWRRRPKGIICVPLTGSGLKSPAPS